MRWLLLSSLAHGALLTTFAFLPLLSLSLRQGSGGVAVELVEAPSMVGEGLAGERPDKKRVRQGQKISRAGKSGGNFVSYSDLIGFGNSAPNYPAQALKWGWEGEVLLRIVFSSKGIVDRVTLLQSSGYSLLDEEALRTVKGWKVPAWERERVVILPVGFRISDVP